MVFLFKEGKGKAKSRATICFEGGVGGGAVHCLLIGGGALSRVILLVSIF